MKRNNIMPLCLGLMLIVMLALALAGCGRAEDQYLRLHIRANSNAPAEQAVKLVVRDAVVAHITPMAKGVTTKRQMQALLADKTTELTQIAEDVLRQNGYTYSARCYLSNEKFPQKTYGDLTLAEGYYDALIIELGTGEGDNWWCVAFPPLCFVAVEETEQDEIVYRSVIADWFRTHCK